MGKAIIILVLAASIVVAYGAMSNNETGYHTAKNQSNYEENVLAREIARSGFNTAMGILRQHGDNLQAGVMAINGEPGYLEGEQQGGVYRAHAQFISGHSVEVISRGYFGGSFDADGEYVGGAVQSIEDSFIYHLPRTPLHVSECGGMELQVLNSNTNYCSAIYMVRHLPGAAGPTNPELILPSGKNRNGIVPVVNTVVAGGTRMNFFIAVDQNCSQQPANWETYDYENHVFNQANYDHIHPALTIEPEGEQGASEAIWAMVDQHPGNNQRWRIAWEDEHDWNLTNPNRPHFHDPTKSLMGLKMYGYDVAGWPTTDALGYRALQTFSGRPDLNDQVVEVVMNTDECVPTDGEGSEGGDDEGGSEGEGSEGGGGDDGGEGGSEPTAEACTPCSGSNQVRIMHRPPGNPGNEQAICVGAPAVSAHLSHHDDYVICPASGS